jgi:anti-sigma factor RsiW
MNGDDEILTGYLDGRLSPDEAAAFERRLSLEPALGRRLRLARAARELLRASAPAMPADLKESLKREARRRAATARGPRWVDLLRSSLTASPWVYGVGAAFAAAALVVAVRFAAAPREEAIGVARRDAPAAKAVRAKVSADLWSDDDGSDHDE